MSSADKYKVKWSARFKKDYKLTMKRGYNKNKTPGVQELHFKDCTILEAVV